MLNLNTDKNFRLLHRSVRSPQSSASPVWHKRNEAFCSSHPSVYVKTSSVVNQRKSLWKVTVDLMSKQNAAVSSTSLHLEPRNILQTFNHQIRLLCSQRCTSGLNNHLSILTIINFNHAETPTVFYSKNTWFISSLFKSGWIINKIMI